MKKSELKQIIKECLLEVDPGSGGPVDVNLDEATEEIKEFRISCYEGSYQFFQSKFNGTLETAKKLAMNKLKKQYEYRQTQEILWAAFDILVDGKWDEDFNDRIKYKKY